MSGGTAPAAVCEAKQLIGFRRHLRVDVVAGEAAYLLSERGVTALTGQHVETLAPLLDGTRDLPAVLSEMPPGTTLAQLEATIARLTEAGLVTRWPALPACTNPEALAYWDTCGIDAATTCANLQNARVALVTVGDIDSAAVTAALSTADLTVTAGPDEEASMSVVLCADYLAPDLAEIDAAHRRAGRPWLLAKPVGATVWVGPIFQPPGHACWQCLAARLTAHRQAEAYLQSTLGRNGPAPRSAVSIPPLAAAAAHVVTLETVKWLAGYRYPDQHSVWTLDSFSLQGRHHPLTARPQCPACGDPTIVRNQARRPVELRPRQKAFHSGGHRARRPEQVLADYRHLISPVTGVVKEITRDRRGPAFFNAFRAGPNLYARANSLRGMKSILRMENGGKGVTSLHAEVSALGEAIERYSSYFTGDEERIPGSFRSLGEAVIHPNRCQLYDERQYVGRAQWNATQSPFHYICDPFDEGAAMNWTPVWSLTHRRHRLLPTSLLYHGAPSTPGACYARADSNGNAAGASLEDAVLHGLLELVERDAVALWWYNRTRAPQIDLDAFADPWIDELREVYGELGRQVWALDLTSDVNVPTVVALSRRTGGDHEGIMLGFGSHPDPRIALLRALTELNQLMPAVVEADRNGAYSSAEDPDLARWLRCATLTNQPYLTPDPAESPRRPADYGYVPCLDLAADVEAIRTRLEALGLEMLVLDMTRPDIGLPVAKVIVPGMRHFRARLAPGRLYDVPVRLGRLKRPTRYDQLNPIPLFI